MSTVDLKSPRSDLNRLPPPYHGGALPTELQGHGQSLPKIAKLLSFVNRTSTLLSLFPPGSLWHISKTSDIVEKKKRRPFWTEQHTTAAAEGMLLP